MSTQKGNEQANMSLVGHLREIRNRIALSVVALLAAFVICFAIIKPLANAMLQMGLDAGFQYVYLSPSELLTSYFKLALVLAVVVVSPLLIFQIWGFVAPALTKKEKRAIRPALLPRRVVQLHGRPAVYDSVPGQFQHVGFHSLCDLRGQLSGFYDRHAADLRRCV